MIEITKTFWLSAGDELPSLEGISLCDNSLVYNLVFTNNGREQLVKNISDIREIRCGFEFRMPKINIYIDVDLFTDDIVAVVSPLDTLLPEITVILVINDDNMKKDAIISLSHKKHDLAIRSGLHVNFCFVILKDYRLLGLALMKLSQLKTILNGHSDNLSPNVTVFLELSPSVIINQNDSFYEDTHFEVDNVIAVLSSTDYYNMDTPDTVCGLINMLRQVALCRGISERFFTLSTQEIQFAHSDHSCFYNIVCGESHNCTGCRDKILKNLPLNLGVFDEMVNTALSDNGNKSDFKVLAADWDYIV